MAKQEQPTEETKVLDQQTEEAPATPTAGAVADAKNNLEAAAKQLLLAGRRYAKGEEWLKEAAEAGAGKRVAQVLAPFTPEQQKSIHEFLIAIGAV